jgi:hypothetical protein
VRTAFLPCPGQICAAGEYKALWCLWCSSWQDYAGHGVPVGFKRLN